MVKVILVDSLFIYVDNQKCESAKVNMYKMRKGGNGKVVRKCV